MWNNQIFSLINNQTIENIIVCDNYELANQIARLNYGDTAYAIDTTRYPLSIGDKHIEGKFYLADGTSEVLPNPTEVDRIDSLTSENAILTEYIIDLDYRMSLKELGV